MSLRMSSTPRPVAFHSAACNPTFFLKAVCSTFARATTKSGNTNSLRLSLKLFLV
jgi:hypothetical protein